MQTRSLIDALKRELRRQRKTYRDVANTLDLSEATVRRLFSECDFKLDRLDRVCAMLGLEISDLVELMQRDIPLTESLTLEQERQLVGDTRLLLMAHLLMLKWSFEEVIETYSYTEAEGIRFLAQLDRMKFIQLLPGNRVKLLIGSNFSWIPGGPIAQFFEEKVQSEFYRSRFSGEDEFRVFLSGMLTRRARLALIERIRRVTDEFNQLSSDRSSEPFAEKEGTSLSIAMRPWGVSVFESFRRAEGDA